MDATSVVPAVHQIELHPYVAQHLTQEFDAQHGILTQAWSPIGGITFYGGGGQGTLGDPAIAAIAQAHGKSPAQAMLRSRNGAGRSPGLASRDLHPHRPVWRKAQKALFALDATLEVHVGGAVVLDLSGADDIVASFTEFSATTKRSFHMSGQQVVRIDGDAAHGVAYCQVKVVSDEDGAEVLTDSSVRYDDIYSRIDGRWVIQRRATQFTISDNRPL